MITCDMLICYIVYNAREYYYHLTESWPSNNCASIRPVEYYVRVSMCVLVTAVTGQENMHLVRVQKSEALYCEIGTHQGILDGTCNSNII